MQLFEADSKYKVTDAQPQFVHHNHFHRLNDGFFGVTDNWQTVPDTSWGQRYGPPLEEAMLMLAKNVTASS